MNILINALSAKKGGGLTYLNNLIYYLNKIIKQDKIFLLVSKNNKIEFQKRNLENVILLETEVSNIMHRLYYEQCIIPSIVKNKRIDILYSPAEILSFFSPCKNILGTQNPNIYYESSIKRSLKEELRYIILNILAKLSIRRADKIIAVSNVFKKQILKKNMIQSNKIITIYHGINPKDFSNTQLDKDFSVNNIRTGNMNYILCVAHLWRHKNIEVLIDAYKKLDSKLRVKYKLIVVGEKGTSYYKELKKRSEKRELNKDIIFLGNVNSQEIKKIYTQANVFVLPSKLESFGIILLEAMSAGIPIIASNSTAIPEILGDAGLLFNPNDSDELVEKLEKVLTDSKLKKELINKGYKRVKNYSWEKAARKTLKVFEEVYNG